MSRPGRSALVLVLLLTAGAASAQTRLPPRAPAPPPGDPFTIRGFGDVGFTSFTAAETFKAVLGTESGSAFGGGVEVDLRSGLYFGVRASRFRKDGHRIFVFQGRTFALDVPTTVTVTPVEITAGYRFAWGGLVVPYAGGGFGWNKYQETSPSATDNENVNEQFRGYHVLGGAEVRATRWIAAALEAEWTTVPDAIGDDPGSAAAAFDEHDLGGVTFRVKVIVGR